MDYKISVIGLGYVGLPIAAVFGKTQQVIGFDIKETRIQQLRDGIDVTGEVTSENLRRSKILFTSDAKDLCEANFHIIAVPTPVDAHNQPDFGPLRSASTLLGGVLKKGDIVVYESTVYPGATEDVCLPILEKLSKLKGGVDFHIGYSPERINPSDKVHTFENIVKVVAGDTPEITSEIAKVYGSVVKAGTFQAKSIKVAEAAKVIENTQRDLNIALMNELAQIFNKIGIATHDVLEAAGTKWNFLKFTPGLVGGHCISIDPYYLSYKAISLGIQPEVILAGRRINDGMGKYVGEQTVKRLIHNGVSIKGARVGVFGFTFKENCPDIRNSKVKDVVDELLSFGMNVLIHDPIADAKETHHEYGFELKNIEELQNLDAVVLAVAHDEYKMINADQWLSKVKANGLIVDVKSLLKKEDFSKSEVSYWCL